MFNFNISGNRNLLSLILGLVIFLIILLISYSNLLYVFDKKITDIYFKFANNKVSQDILVVEIDEDTLSGRKDRTGKVITQGLGRFPFDRKHYATVIDNLSEDGALLVGLDIIFGEKSNLKSDLILANSVKKAGNVVLGSWPNDIGEIQLPYGNLGKNALAVGFFPPNIDKVTNVVYSIRPYSKFKGSEKINDSFSLAILRSYYSLIYNDKSYLTSKYDLTNKYISIGNKIKIERSRDFKNEMLINYTNSKNYNKVSFLDIHNGDYDPELVKDKIVLIGSTAKGIKDIFNTPLGVEYGVYTHVNSINTILTKNHIKYFDSKIEWLLIFLLIIVSVYYNLSASGKILFFSNFALLIIYVVLIIYIVLLTNLTLNYPFELLFGFIFSLTISNIIKYIVENKNKIKLNKALSEYVSSQVAREIISGKGELNLDGENKNIAIFFSDIEGFTTISEKFTPEKLVGFLREYLKDMSDIIMDNRGFINKYEGDAIMGLWGAFGKDERKSENICISALQQQKILKELNIGWNERGFDEIKARIGIHIGDAIIGNIGSEGRKMEFTALGDSVNLASRLEGVNKFYGTYICASEVIYELEKDNFDFRYLDKIKVKGKDIPIKIYELLGKKGETDEIKLNIKSDFEFAVELYLNRDFEKALEKFELLYNSFGDMPSKTYITICKGFLINPPSSDWDGISTMTGK